MNHPNKLVKNALALAIAASPFPAFADAPNIVTIMLDDVAPMDISAYHRAGRH
ncbi:hypothetical protein JCM19236_2182 [Vibrio sp. JCM 19236]|nr:hypothetical protein JCM19236_2182 [Vibrio sp. JCM 19236]